MAHTIYDDLAPVTISATDLNAIIRVALDAIDILTELDHGATATVLTNRLDVALTGDIEARLDDWQIVL
jgi:hypothetical protein